MLNAEQVLGIYENVSVLTRQMLAAGAGIRLGPVVRAGIALRARGRPAAQRGPVAGGRRSSAELRERKVQMLRQILDDDRAIRDLTEPWLQRLQGLIHNTGQQRKLEQAYGGF